MTISIDQGSRVCVLGGGGRSRLRQTWIVIIGKYFSFDKCSALEVGVAILLGETLKTEVPWQIGVGKNDYYKSDPKYLEYV